MISSRLRLSNSTTVSDRGYLERVLIANPLFPRRLLVNQIIGTILFQWTSHARALLQLGFLAGLHGCNRGETCTLHTGKKSYQHILLF